MNDSEHEEKLLTIEELLKLARVSVDTLNELEKATYFKEIKCVDGVDWSRRYTRKTAEILTLIAKCKDRCTDLREAYDTALRVIAQKRIETNGPGEAGRYLMMDPKAIETYPRFESLHGFDEGLQADLTENIGIEGYDENQRIVLAIWPGQKEPVVADGKLRLKAAIAAGLKQVPVVIKEFIDEEGVLQLIAWAQTHRRPTDDWVLYGLITELDRLMQRGGDRRSEDAKSKPPYGGFENSRSPSAHRTAALLRCPARTVERARRIRKHGTEEILKALKKRTINIYQADKAIAEKATGVSNTPPAPPTNETRDDMVQLTPENLDGLNKLGRNRHKVVNTAVREFLARELQESDASEETDSERG